MSDPRVSGTFTETSSGFGIGGLDVGSWVFWGTEVMEDPQAGWDCSSTGTSDPTAQRNSGLMMRVCAGTGANAGLSYVAYKAMMGESYGDFGDRKAIKGILYEGDPPPFGPLAPMATE
jgi:hypothetical protein